MRDAAEDLMRAAGWSAADFARAMGGPIAFVREDANPITSNRHRLLGTYDPRRRILTANNWTYEFGEEAGRRNIVHELAHAWDQCSGYRLSRGLGRLAGTRASAYAATSRFEDWAEAVMATVYGPEPGFEAFDAPHPYGGPTRREYVERAFARYRGAAEGRHPRRPFARLAAWVRRVRLFP